MGIFIVWINVNAKGVDASAQNSTVLTEYLNSKEQTQVVKANFEKMQPNSMLSNSTKLNSPVLLASAASTIKLKDDEEQVSTSGTAVLAQKSPDPEDYSAGKPATSSYSQRDPIEIYIVKSGETLFSIASKFGLSYWTLYQDSKFEGDNLRPGQSISIPAVDGKIHTVESGETLDSILAKYNSGSKKQTTIKVNKLDGADDIKEGMLIIIPGVKLSKPEPKPEVTTPTATSFARTQIYTPTTNYSAPASYSGGSIRASTALAGRVSQGCRYGHVAIDVGAPVGSAIRAAESGVVTAANWGNGYGMKVEISHGGGTSTLYAHMSSFAVSGGQSVSKGQIIGYVGMTGWTTGPHLHFELKQGGSKTCPAY